MICIVNQVRPSLDQHVLRVDDNVYFDFIPTSNGQRKRAVHFDMSGMYYTTCQLYDNCTRIHNLC